MVYLWTDPNANVWLAYVSDIAVWNLKQWLRKSVLRKTCSGLSQTFIYGNQYEYLLFYEKMWNFKNSMLTKHYRLKFKTFWNYEIFYIQYDLRTRCLFLINNFQMLLSSTLCEGLNTWKQARNQLGTPGRAKSFLRGAELF